MSEAAKDATKVVLQGVAHALDQYFNGAGPKKTGFVLLTFPFDGPEGQRCNYVSNGQRKDVLATLKEVVARFDGQPLQRGTA